MARKCVYLSCILWLSILNFVSSQSMDEENYQSTSETPTENTLVSGILSELGKFALDVDDMIYRSISPATEFSSRIDQPTPGRQRESVSTYFDRVRENYRDLQKKIGSSLENSPFYSLKVPDWLNLNFQNKGRKTSLDISSPYLNVNVKAKTSVPKATTEPNVESGANIKDATAKPETSTLYLPISEQPGAKSISNKDKLVKEESGANDLVSGTESNDFQKRSSRGDRLSPIVPKNGFRRNKNVYAYKSNINSENVDKNSESLPFEEDILEEPESFDRVSGVQGRILGDLMYSESTFDKYFRQLLKNHKWLVDPKLFPPKRIIENIRESTRGYLDNSPSQTNQDTVSSKMSNKPGQSFKESNIHSEDIEDTWMPPSKTNQKPQSLFNLRLSSRVILAFTPEGVPLKLKMGPQITNPVQFLHKTLSAYKVSLNIPIDSGLDNKPTGTDILQVGSGPGGMLTHALYLDLSDEMQLKSLIRALKKYSK